MPAQRLSLAREVAQADTVLTNHLPAIYVKPTRSNFLIDTAKKLQRLQTKASKLRRELKVTEAEIRMRKHELRAVAAAADSPTVSDERPAWPVLRKGCA